MAFEAATEYLYQKKVEELEAQLEVAKEALEFVSIPEPAPSPPTEAAVPGRVSRCPTPKESQKK